MHVEPPRASSDVARASRPAPTADIQRQLQRYADPQLPSRDVRTVVAQRNHLGQRLVVHGQDLARPPYQYLTGDRRGRAGVAPSQELYAATSARISRN